MYYMHVNRGSYRAPRAAPALGRLRLWPGALAGQHGSEARPAGTLTLWLSAEEGP